MKKIILSIALFLFASVAFAQTAKVQGKSYSLMLNSTVINIGGNNVEFLFTTYDGNRYSYPYYYDPENSTITYSREVKKLANFYYTDYYSLLNGFIDDYGEIVLNFGIIDMNSNGIDDVCEVSQSVNKSISGNWYSKDGSTGKIGGTLIKNSGSQQGALNLLVEDTWAGDVAASCTFYSGSLTGEAIYSKSNLSIEINFSSTWDRKIPFDPIKTVFNIINSDTVEVKATGFFPTTALKRKGNTYSAVVELLDGGLSTFWPDYQKWFVQLVDTNDSDGDGIPDLSDNKDNLKKGSLPFLPLLLD